LALSDLEGKVDVIGVQASSLRAPIIDLTDKLSNAETTLSSLDSQVNPTTGTLSTDLAMFITDTSDLSLVVTSLSNWQTRLDAVATYTTTIASLNSRLDDLVSPIGVLSSNVGDNNTAYSTANGRLTIPPISGYSSLWTDTKERIDG